jgi:hypothetical protein
MNTHLQTLLSSSGIAMRNVGMSLLGAYKIIGRPLIPQLISPTNKILRPINKQISGQKLRHQFSLSAFPPVSIPASMRPL